MFQTTNQLSSTFLHVCPKLRTNLNHDEATIHQRWRAWKHITVMEPYGTKQKVMWAKQCHWFLPPFWLGNILYFYLLKKIGDFFIGGWCQDSKAHGGGYGDGFQLGEVWILPRILGQTQWLAKWGISWKPIEVKWIENSTFVGSSSVGRNDKQ